MARETYNQTTPETVAAVEHHVKEFAYETGKSEQYFRAVLAGTSSDPFAKFITTLFRPAARKNAEGARGFIARLEAILNAEQPPPGESSQDYELLSLLAKLTEAVDKQRRGRASDAEVERARSEMVEATLRFGARERVGAEAGG